MAVQDKLGLSFAKLLVLNKQFIQLHAKDEDGSTALHTALKANPKSDNEFIPLLIKTMIKDNESDSSIIQVVSHISYLFLRQLTYYD